MKQFIVVAYDISDDKRRQKIAKVLEQHGIRCNESVFECLLTESRINALKQKLNRLVDLQEDSLLIYFLCKPCVLKRETLGKRPGFAPEIVMV